MEIPKQEKQEPVSVYVLRACHTLQAVGKPGEGIKTSAKLAEEEARKREIMDRLQGDYSTSKHYIVTPRRRSCSRVTALRKLALSSQQHGLCNVMEATTSSSSRRLSIIALPIYLFLFPFSFDA
jgi:hypothetical protein